MIIINGKKHSLLLGVLVVCIIAFALIAMDNVKEKNIPVTVKPGTPSAEQSLNPTGSGQNLPLQPENGQSYFVDYRIEREKMRSHQIELLKEIVNNPNSIAETRKDAQEKLLKITSMIENEFKLEKLIIAKGYQDALAFIQADTLMIIVKASRITDQDTSKIADLAVSATGFDYQDIVIVNRE